MAPARVSVIMLTYNRETMVGRAINSVLGQTFSDFEFIIVDNGSTDDSGAIAEEFGAKDARIKVIRRIRGNIGSGRNTGLDASTGQYIAFIDDDDWCEPDFLSFLYELATKNKTPVSICGTNEKPINDKLILTAEEALLTLMHREKYNSGFPTKMFKRELSGHIRFPESGEYDDISQMHRLLAHAGRAAYHGLPKYNVCRHAGNNSAWTRNHELLTGKTLEAYLRAYRDRTLWLSGMFPGSAPAFCYFEWSFMISMVEKISRLDIKGCEGLLHIMVMELRKNRREFSQSEYLTDFEREWLDKYIEIV